MCAGSVRALADELGRAGAPVHLEVCDLTDVAKLKRAVAALREVLGPIGVLVNNAAMLVLAWRACGRS